MEMSIPQVDTILYHWGQNPEMKAHWHFLLLETSISAMSVLGNYLSQICQVENERCIYPNFPHIWFSRDCLLSNTPMGLCWWCCCAGYANEDLAHGKSVHYDLQPQPQQSHFLNLPQCLGRGESNQRVNDWIWKNVICNFKQVRVCLQVWESQTLAVWLC